MTLSMQKLPGALDAMEILGLDIARDGTREAARIQLREALAEHGVICVRQSTALDDAGMRQLVEMIGPIKDPVAPTKDGAIIRYSDERQIIDSGHVMTEEQRKKAGDVSVGGDAVRPGLFQFFHTDDSYVEEPAAATVLHAR